MSGKKSGSNGFVTGIKIAVAVVTFIATVVGLWVNIINISDRYKGNETESQEQTVATTETESESGNLFNKLLNKVTRKDDTVGVFNPREQYAEGTKELTFEPLFEVSSSVNYYVVNNSGTIVYYDEESGLLKNSLGKVTDVFDVTKVKTNEAALVYNQYKDEIYFLYAHFIFVLDDTLELNPAMQWENTQDGSWRIHLYNRSTVSSEGILHDQEHGCLIDTNTWTYLSKMGNIYKSSFVNDNICEYTGGTLQYYDKAGNKTDKIPVKYKLGFDEYKYDHGVYYFFGDNGLYLFKGTDGIMYYFDGREEYAIPAYTFDKRYEDVMNEQTFKNGNTLLFVRSGWLYKGYVE